MTTDWYTKITITSWEHFQQVYESTFGRQYSSRWVFRGQQDARWDLKPSLERVVRDRVGLEWEWMTEVESFMLERFQRNLYRFQARIPAADDHLEWLALMQHHGAPTRLLDWTYSSYIALFFALELAPLGTTCAIWAINQTWLFNRLKARQESGVLEAFRIHPRLRSAGSAQPLLTTNISSVAPLVPFHQNERIAIQQGVFLVPLNLETSFMDNLQSVAEPDELCNNIFKLEIPVERPIQYQTLVSLDRLNINRLNLFPGIDGFAQSMQISPMWWHEDSRRK